MASSESGSIVTSRSNARVKLLRAAFDGQARLAEGLVALEGHKLLDEALRSGMELKVVFVSEGRDVPHSIPSSVEVVRLAEDVFSSAVETQSPQGVAALFAPPMYKRDCILAGTPLIVVAANLQDPGNLGTIIRSAEAFGATGVLMTPGTVRPWNQKALRASAGSIFRTPVIATSVEDLANLKTHDITLVAAVASDTENVIAARAADLTRPTAILIGNEGSGLSADLLALADVLITIPCPGPVESLNAAVAASLLLYEASQQRASRTARRKA